MEQICELNKHHKLGTEELIRYNSQSVVLQLPHHKYLDKVLRSNSYEELMWRFKDADSPSKEITESYAAFSNMKKICRVNLFNWLHIGDGGYARTAAIFAFFSKSLNLSIDPALNMVKYTQWRDKFNVERLVGLNCKFSEVKNFTELDKNKFYNICCVHAHVNLEKVDQHFPDWKFFYTNPCCYPQQQEFSSDYMKENKIHKIVDKLDMGILSERRRVIIYRKFR